MNFKRNHFRTKSSIARKPQNEGVYLQQLNEFSSVAKWVTKLESSNPKPLTSWSKVCLLLELVISACRQAMWGEPHDFIHLEIRNNDKHLEKVAELYKAGHSLRDIAKQID